LLVGEAAAWEFGAARAKLFKLRLALRDLHLAVAVKAAVVVHQIADAVPQLHGGDRERHLGEMAAEAAHAAGVDARGMAADVILLNDGDAGAAAREMPRRR